MLKDRPDFKLINLAIIAFIIFLICETNHFWIGVIGKLSSILFPFLIAFTFAYALYPFITFLKRKKIPKNIAILFVLALVIGVLLFLIFTIFPLLFEQLGSLFNSIITFLKEISMQYDINFGPLQESLSDSFNDIIKALSRYIRDGAITVVSVSLNYITSFIVALSAAIYFLIDMDKIRENIKKSLLKTSKKWYIYVSKLDHAMKNYLLGFLKIVIITIFEYTIAFLLIGHPNAILLGTLAAFTSFIPYFGGLLTNLIAAITAFVISPHLFTKTIITFCILSILDSYIINPLIYGKTNQIHPVLVIFSVAAGGILLGTFGIIISLPLAILILTSYQYFKHDVKKISKKITKA